MEFCCRKLSKRDIDMVLRMNEDFRSGFVCRKSARVFLKNPQNWMFAALSSGRIIGFAYGYELTRLDGAGNMLYIHEVGVVKKLQRQGIGSRLMTELKAACKSRGLCRYFLITDRNNTGANALYQKLGGEVSVASQGSDVVYHFSTQ